MEEGGGAVEEVEVVVVMELGVIVDFINCWGELEEIKKFGELYIPSLIRRL